MRLILMYLLAAVVQADELHLADGRVLEGEVAAADQGRLAVTMGAAGFQATVYVEAGAVVRRVSGDTPRQQRIRALDRIRAADGGPSTAAGWWQLAVGYRQVDERLAATACARSAIKLDTDHAEARQMLGFVRVDGPDGQRWATPAQAAMLRGEVLFRGRWMPPQERDAILADEERAAAERHTAEAERREQRLARLAEAERRAALSSAEAPTLTIVSVGPPLLPPLLARPCPDPVLQLSGSGRLWGVDWRLDWR